MQRMFRAFAEQTKSDLKALAACIRGSRQVMTQAEVASIQLPTLVSVGTNDPIAGSAQALARLMPNATAPSTFRAGTIISRSATGRTSTRFWSFSLRGHEGATRKA